jgi:type II secretory ATPase GspE/PulE/Tfp pilus assembly ATPase PilB-like protein
MHVPTGLIAAAEMGGYINLLKLLPVIVFLLLWAKAMTWMDKDAVAAHLPREALNTALFLSGIGAFILFYLLPNFWIALGTLFVVLAGTIGTYLGIRNQRVGLADLKKDFADWRAGLSKGKKVDAREGQVLLATRKGAVVAPPEPEDPQRPGYEAAQVLLTEPLKKGAERIDLRPGDGACPVQYWVDGVAYSSVSLDRAAAAAVIAFLKGVAGLEVEDRRKPQTGMLRGTLDGKRHELEVTTAGTTAGESLRVLIDPRKRHDFKLETLGLQPGQLEAIRNTVADPSGVVLITAPRQQGLTTLLYAVIRSHDAFLNHIQSIEHDPREDLEGVTQNRLASTASIAEELKLVEWVTSTQPDVILMDELFNPASARELLHFAQSENKRVYIGMRAGTTFDALGIWRKLIGDDSEAASVLKLIIAGRVMRRLCMACKVGYTPDPETLRKLNMDPQRVTTLYQARTEPLRDSRGNPVPCEFCHDLRYKGRFGVYETFVIDDEIRQAIASGGSTNQLKTLFRKQRARYLQEMALAQVEAGETSVQEVLRVLRGSEQSRPTRQASA